MANSYLMPRAAIVPSNGNFEPWPIVVILEADSAAGLQAEFELERATQASDVHNVYIIESVDYQVAVTKPEQGNQPAEMRYSALVFGYRLERV